MILFQGKREYNAHKELSDSVTEEEYINALKLSIESHHIHKDGSAVELEIVKGERRKEITADFFEDAAPSSAAIVFSCNCGRDLLAEQKNDKVTIATYLPQRQSGYNVEQTGSTYNSNSSAVIYGGK